MVFLIITLLYDIVLDSLKERGFRYVFVLLFLTLFCLLFTRSSSRRIQAEHGWPAATSRNIYGSDLLFCNIDLQYRFPVFCGHALLATVDQASCYHATQHSEQPPSPHWYLLLTSDPWLVGFALLVTDILKGMLMQVSAEVDFIGTGRGWGAGGGMPLYAETRNEKR